LFIESWSVPGVARWFELDDASFTLAQRLVASAREKLAAAHWRVFDGDLDLKTPSGQSKGAIDGVADKNNELSSMALIELKVKKLQQSRVMKDTVSSLCCVLDEKWTKHRVPRLHTPWTHGVLVVLWQHSCKRSFSGLDECQLVVWRRGAPPVLVACVAPIAMAAQSRPKAKAAPTAARVIAPADRFESLLATLKTEGAVLGPGSSWCSLPSFLKKLGLAANQAKRDHLTGSTCWKIGEGRGVKLRENEEWAYKKGRGGGRKAKGNVYVKVGTLKEVHDKYYMSRRLCL
jgi:hypothetical protein